LAGFGDLSWGNGWKMNGWKPASPPWRFASDHFLCQLWVILGSIVDLLGVLYGENGKSPNFEEEIYLHS